MVRLSVSLIIKMQRNIMEGRLRSILTIPRHTFHYALLLQDIGDSKNARKHYERAINIDPSYARAHYHLALLLNEEIAAVEMDKASKALTRAGGSATS